MPAAGLSPMLPGVWPSSCLSDVPVRLQTCSKKVISMPYETQPSPHAKSCCRCGNEFRTSARERVCPLCRKPTNSVWPARRKDLSFRETQVVQLVAKGKSNKEIACQLLLSEGTIKEYLNRIFRKVDVTNRTELAIWEFTRKAATPGSSFESSSAFEERPMIN